MGQFWGEGNIWIWAVSWDHGSSTSFAEPAFIEHLLHTGHCAQQALFTLPPTRSPVRERPLHPVIDEEEPRALPKAAQGSGRLRLCPLAQGAPAEPSSGWRCWGFWSSGLHSVPGSSRSCLPIPSDKALGRPAFFLTGVTVAPAALRPGGVAVHCTLPGSRKVTALAQQ